MVRVIGNPHVFEHPSGVRGPVGLSGTAGCKTGPRKAGKKLADKKSNPLAADSFDFARVRLLALYDDPEAAQRKLSAMLEKEPDNPVVQCGYGLLMTRLGNRKEAQSFLRKALQKDPFNPVALTDLGKVYFF